MSNKYIATKVWEIAPQKFDDLIDQILFNRGIIKASNDPEKDKYLNPDFSTDLYDPFLLKNMRGVIKLLKEAIESGKKIGIFADYDADGIPGAALFSKALKAVGAEYSVYIPNREGGYGLSKEGIDLLRKKDCKILVTIDLGIRSFIEAEYCKNIGIPLIITDHHLPDNKLPDADYIINSKQKGDKYSFKELAGCGVIYKVIQALSTEFPEQISQSFLKWNLDLVAISTISDVVPLIGENRTLAKYGLIVIKKTKNLGLRALIKEAGIDAEKIGAYEVGFQIGPRINAPGRVDHATTSYELLTTESEAEAKKLALWLNQKNEERQNLMKKVEEEVSKRIEKDHLDRDNIIVVEGNWQKGIIGPTASKVVEKYGKPAILFAKGKELLTGSARSVSSLSIVELLEGTKVLIKKFGGHAGAAGLTVENSQFDKFKKKIISLANKIDSRIFVKKIRADAVLTVKDLKISLYDDLKKLEPFGMGNPKPVLVSNEVFLNNSRFVGKEENHFSSQVSQEEDRVKTIYFNFPYEKSMIKDEGKYDIIYNLSVDEWNGERKPSLNIIDIKQNERKE